MITLFIRKMIFAIAKMSKKASAIFISVLTVLFLAGLVMLLTSVLYLTNGDPQTWAIILAVVSSFLFLIVVLAIAITAISSNYVRKNPHKDPSLNDTNKE